jgi:dTDP-4-dehydrorhamnose reductase
MHFVTGVLPDPAVGQHASSGAPLDTEPTRVTLPEIWGGIECTVNRVGDQYFDQTIRSGHQERISDLERFADLGIRAIRYPVLWERTAPDGPERADWRWPDERLSALRELGVRPIVGLLHHGSGPRDTSLLDPAFPERLATYARAVAERYPWVEDWTPVNEPLSTARFSSLYGYWYPHHRDDYAFARALLNQCRAVVLAMEAIRSVNGAARLIQTDDLGKTFSTPELAYQAEWENERRWLTWDLLTGTLPVNGPIWGWLRRLGIPDADLRWFLEHPCPPDVVGVNHYLSSARFLDDRLEHYPTEDAGTNGTHRYVDVLAARVLPEEAPGPGDYLQEAWQRYHLPVAITEAHNGCTREEQLRWLDDVWQGAQAARAAGADVRAVTAWSLLGAFDWDQMVTQDQGHYEPGVFDLRAPEPRPTAIAHMVRALATHGEYSHPVLAEPGWWRQPDRLYHPADTDALTPVSTASGSPLMSGTPQPILIVGDESPLLAALSGACQQRYLAHVGVGSQDPALARAGAVDRLLRTAGPWAVIDLRDLPVGRDVQAPRPTETPGLADALASRCAEHGVAYLRWSSVERPHAPADALIIRTEPHEINPGRAAAPQPDTLTETVHAVLDLLIDGDTGAWRLPFPRENPAPE